MATNFQFLESNWSELYERAIKAEEFAKTDPRTSLTYARMGLELAVNWIFNKDPLLQLPHDTSLSSLMTQHQFSSQLPFQLRNEIHLIRKAGNLAIHNKSVSDIDSLMAVENLYFFCRYMVRSYSDTDISNLGPFDFEAVPQKGADKLTKRQLDGLQKEFNREVGAYQDEIEAAKERSKTLQAENDLYKHRILELEALQKAQKEQAKLEDEVHHPRNEKETRKSFIDVSLREAGWDLKGINDREYKVTYMPRSTNQTEIGYVDYVLWDDDGKPLALVEAKRSMENVTKGENQAQLYADSLEKMHGQRPIMYYSNGFETYLWDDQFYKAARPVNGFYTKAELQTMMYRRTHRKDIRNFPIDTNIVERTYQMRSIKSIAEHFAGTDKRTGKLIGTNRMALLVLATGTGKTRTAIALSKVLFEANWAKRILFLADRKSLVRQAKTNFVKFLPEYSSVNLLEDKEKKNTRMVFSTYKTLLNLIDGSRVGGERFYGVGHFDLIIVDEAHRSIYQKYQSIFEYFDGLYLGLTATPKNHIDKNTYEAFKLADGHPTDAYTFEEAVANKHLTPYKTLEVPTKFMKRGIRYSELSEAEKDEFEREILDGEPAVGTESIHQNALNNWLFNIDTAKKTLAYIIKHGIKNRGGDELGKTIIFARNQKHAHFLKDMLLEMDRELFGNDYVKVITHSEPKAQEFIDRFIEDEKERLPQIAISVDMLDTGIDAPRVVNLVFYKEVKSYTKFWQMIGRGSRLRRDLFGVGKDKTHFLIFDLCGNFDFFEENPYGIEGDTQRSITEIVFGLKLQLSQYLNEDHFRDNEELQAFRVHLLDELYGAISSLDRERFDVRMRLKTVLEYGSENRELWNHLDSKDLKKIESELIPLIKPAKGENDLARFYDKIIYSLMIKRLETPDSDLFHTAHQMPITKVAMISKKLLKKTTIPMVKSAEDVIRLPLDKGFWKTEGLHHLNKIRLGIRDLLQFIDKEDQRYVTTNFQDELDYPNIRETGYASEEDVAKSVTESPFTSNIHRLEEIIRNNSDNLTISRIRNGQQITKKELESLEKLLFNDGLKRDELVNELGHELNLTEFIVNLIGLSQEHVDSAFATFINQYQLNSKQISFLDTIKQFITTNGKIDPEKLYESPFVNFHPLAIEGVFTEEQATKIFRIIGQFSKRDIG